MVSGGRADRLDFASVYSQGWDEGKKLARQDAIFSQICIISTDIPCAERLSIEKDATVSLSSWTMN